MNNTIVINYSHALGVDQVFQLEALISAPIADVRDIPTQLDVNAPFGPQAAALAEAAGLTPAQWQTESLLLVPPALNFAAVALLAELHGRMGYFPPIVRITPVGTVPPQYEVAEIINLHGIREEARKRR